MDYSILLEKIQLLDSSNTSPLTLGQITYQPIQKFHSPVEILGALESLREVTGWITWPNHVESILEPTTISPNHAEPPIEGELYTHDARSIRVQYRNQCWELVEVHALPTEAGGANCLLENIKLAARSKNQPALNYQRIWQITEHQGMIATDAIFIGFGGNQ